MRALVLGGAGFIGSHLGRELIKNGLKIRVFDRKKTSLCSEDQDFEFVSGSIQDPFLLAESLSGVDVVFHLISSTVPGTSNLDPHSDVENNLKGTLSLLQAMVNNGVSKLVYFSSGGTVYGEANQLPIPEDHPTEPICSYGVVKLASENYIRMFEKLYGLEAVILRPSNPFGPGQGHLGVQGLVSTFLKKILNHETLTIWGTGGIQRDFIYIQDLVNCCIRICENFKPGTYNLGSGIGHSVLDVIEVIKKVSNRQAKIELLPSRPFDVEKIILDISKIKNTFNWEPVVSLEYGISKLWQDCQK